jgi:hypothetical protein
MEGLCMYVGAARGNIKSRSSDGRDETEDEIRKEPQPREMLREYRT